MTAPTAPAPVDARGLPVPYLWWTGAAGVSTVGSAAFGFAMTWYATGISAGLTGLLGVLITLPRALLLLLGGAAADRFGVRPMLVVGDAVMLVLSLLTAVGASLLGVREWLLVVVALTSGVVDAFYLPAERVLPRLFVSADTLPRATALNSTIAQLALLAGPPCGAVAVVAIGFAGIAAADAGTFAVILAVLLLVRPPLVSPSVGTFRVRDLVRPIRDAWSASDMRAVLVLTGLVAAFVLPAVVYGPSLMARESGWGPGSSGLIELGWLVGGIGVTAVIARRGASHRVRAAVAIGLALIAIGLAGMTSSPVPAGSFAGAVVLGVGVSVCTGHLWPAYLAGTPDDQLGRYQALLVLAQMVTLVISTVLFTTVAGLLGARWSLACCGVGMLATLAWWAGRGSPGTGPFGTAVENGVPAARRL